MRAFRNERKILTQNVYVGKNISDKIPENYYPGENLIPISGATFDLRFPFRNETYFQSFTFHCYHNISMIPLTTARGYKKADDFSDSQVHLLNSSPFFFSIQNIFFASCLFLMFIYFHFLCFSQRVVLVTRSF